MDAERPVWAATHVGHVRSSNQDRCLVGDWRSDGTNASWRGALAAERGWALVADGMGGHEAGDVASRVAVETISRFIGQAESPREIAAMLDTANRDLFEAMHSGDGRPGMGTTIVGVRWTEREALIFNLGDSRAYRACPKGLAQVSRDDTLGGHGLPGGGRSHVLTQCLGGSRTPRPLRPHIDRLPLAHDTGLLLCSDGLTDMLNDDEIARVLAQNANDPAEQLVAAALDAGGQDNVTVVIVGPAGTRRIP
jgi:serine/threonine protein phosphatase PrpC